MKRYRLYSNIWNSWGLRMVVLLLSLHACWSATAQNGADTITIYNEEHPLIYEDAWDLWPYTFLNDNGEPDGYNIDLLKLIFKRLDIPYLIKLKPTVDALKDLKSGKADLMCGMDANFHDEFAHYGKSIIHLFTHSVAHQKGVEQHIKQLSDLANNEVIVHTGSFSHHLMEDRGWGENAKGYEDMKEAVQDASNDPTAEIVWNTMSLKWLIQKYQIKNMELSPIEIPHGEYKFMSNNQHLLNQIDSVYAILLSEERLQPIQNKWFYPERTESGLPSWIWKLASATAVLAVFSLFCYLWFRFREKKLTQDLRKKNDRLSLILRTSNVRFWTYDIPTKTFTWMDEHGKAVHDYTILEFSQRYDREDFIQLTEAINQIVRQESEQATLYLKGEGREFRESLAILRRNKNGRPSMILGTRSDITEEKQQQQAAENMMLRYQAIFNTAMIDMIFFDANGVLSDFNDMAAKTFGTTREQTRKSPITLEQTMMMDDIDLDHFERMHVTRIFNMNNATQHIKNAVDLKGKMCYEIQLVPVYNQQHQLLGIYGSGRNVTEVVNSYNRNQENLRRLQKANDEVTSYIQNINYVLKVGGIRMTNYSSKTHMLTIFSEIGHTEYELTQTRALMLTCERDKHTVQRLLNSMDNHTVAPIETTIQTTLKTKGRPLCLEIQFVPIIEDDGSASEYFGMCRDVSEIKHTESELAKETAKAQEVEVVKNAFLRNMSYEIRTPLNTVVGFAELFEMEHSSDDEALFIDEIKNNSRSLLKLINNILFLSRLDAQMIEFNPQTTDFAKVFDMNCNTSWENLRQPGVNYIIDNAYDQLVVEIDAQNTGIILDQIIQNACQNTTHGTVRARLDYIGDQLIMAVEDSGCGIPDELLSTIFERFATGANTGSGLGLSICYELTQQMGGTINIKSKVGKGTTVWVSLPCKASEITRK